MKNENSGLPPYLLLVVKSASTKAAKFKSVPWRIKNMKIVQVVQRKFELLGICSNQSRLNGSYVMTWLVYVIGTASSTVFLIHGASSFQEYTNNLYMTTALWVGYIYFTIMFFKMEKLFILIDNVEKVLDKSEWKWPPNETSALFSIFTMKIFEFIFRIWKSDIKSNLWPYQSAGGKNHSNWICCHSDRFTHVYCLPKSARQLLHVLRCGYGQWNVRAAIVLLVNSTLNNLNNF